MSKNHKNLPSLIGVIHLPPLPGSPRASGEEPSIVFAQAGLQAIKEAQILAKAGFDGIIIENFGDTPFFKNQVGPETIAAMAVIGAAIREAVPISLGINILRNDARGALAVAAIIGADFIRVNVLSGVVATDQGLIEGCAAELIREKMRLGAESVAILADVQVKHAKTLSSDSLVLSIEEAAGRGSADAVVITGTTTGRAPDEKQIKEAFEAAQKTGVPLYIGSGATPEMLRDLFLKAGKKGDLRIIVGSALRRGGKAGEPLDLKRIQELMKVWKSLSSARKSTKKKRKK